MNKLHLALNHSRYIFATLFLLMVTLGGFLKSDYSSAFLNSVAVATNNVIGSEVFDTCTEGIKWLDEVVTFDQGTLKNGNPITDPARIDEEAVLGAIDGQFFALGVGGTLTAKFENPILDQSGPDVDLTVNETTNGRDTYPEETALVEVSQDGTTWVALPNPATSKATNGVNQLDIAGTGLSWIEYIRFTDTTNYGPHASNADGFDIESVQATYGVCDDLPLDEKTISGAKYHDENGNGQRDNGETGLADWDIYATTKIWESDVLAQNTPAVVSPTLDNGEVYVARVTGTYNANDGVEADAMYSYRTPTSSEWTDSVNTYEGYGPTLLDLQIDGSSPNWGDYNADHTYWIPLTGSGAAKSFEIYDLANGDNDSGQLHVELFKVVESAITDVDGNYTLTILGYNDETLYIFEGNQSGWSQTQPGPTSYYYEVAAGAQSLTLDFGNQQQQAPDELADVTVCKVDQNQQPLNNWQVLLHNPTAADSVSVYPSNALGGFGGNTNQVTTSEALALGDYVVIANGTYVYRGTAGATDSDATFSQRDPGDSVYGGAYAPWVNVMTFPAPNTGWLGVMVNGGATNWSTVYADDHRYAVGYTNYSGAFNFTILDDQYGDNGGQIGLSIYPGWTQTTGNDGCTTFANVPFGSYTLDEIMQTGWEYEDGDRGTVQVNDQTEQFTLVNQLEGIATLPSSYITVSNSPEKRIEDRIQNGSFEVNGGSLDNWNVSGDVSLVTAESFTDPQDGDHMVKIGKAVNEGNPASLNVITQEIPAGVRSLGFYYNMFTYDSEGFDDPGFMVFANDEMVYQRWANELDADDPLGDEVTLDSTGWEYIGLDLSRYPDGTTLTLAFYAGNDVSNLPNSDAHQTWVYVDNFSTNEAVVNSDSLFEIHTNPGDTAYYRIGTDPTIHTGNTFSLSSQPNNQRIYYWSANGDATEPTNSFHVLYDDVAPEQITDLNGTYVETNLFDLTWTSPHDDNNFTDGSSNPAWYEIRYSTTPIEGSTEWSTLSEVSIVTEDGLPHGGYRAPKPEDEQENYRVRVFDVADNYYFAVKSFDAATNMSTISNIASVNPDGEVVIDTDSDIVLNEFLADPVGADTAGKPNGEWVELYNKSDQPVEVNGWVLYDNNNDNELVISASNSDNNLNPEDGGETIVPANGWLTVYRNGDDDFNLDQGAEGDSVRLYNDLLEATGQLIDSHTYTGVVPENKSIARVPDGVGEWMDPVPTPGRKNVENPDHLEPLVRIWQHEPYNAKVTLYDALNYDNAEFSIEYTHTTHGSQQTEMINDGFSIDEQVETVSNIYLATCSTGGECIPHTGVANIKVTVVLTGTGIPERTLTENLLGDWNE